jgi:hypothetical protein
LAIFCGIHRSEQYTTSRWSATLASYWYVAGYVSPWLGLVSSARCWHDVEQSSVLTVTSLAKANPAFLANPALPLRPSPWRGHEGAGTAAG